MTEPIKNACPECGGTELYSRSNNWICKTCGRQFRKRYRKREYAHRAVKESEPVKTDDIKPSVEQTAKSVLDILSKVEKSRSEGDVTEFQLIGDKESKNE